MRASLEVTFPKTKAPVEVTFLETSWPPRREGVLCIGRGDLAIVDVTIPERDMDTKPWFRGIAPLYARHRLRAPLVVGLVALRGRAPHDRARRGHPRRHGNPIRCVVICVGDTHALVYHPDCDYHSNSKYTGGALPFPKGSKLARLRAFLANRRVTVACVGAREAAEKLAVEWELDVARPAELTDLFARAFGKDAGVKPPKEPEPESERWWPDRWWMTLSEFLMAQAKAKAAAAEAARKDYYHGYSKLGGRPVAEVVKGLSLERMARVALGPEMRLAPWPAKAADADWGSPYLEKSDVKYAVRDAFLCFEIATRCLRKLGAPVGN
uniref:3'-5' exonuclease domain-containing protein n=1 Tax=Leersia perrieri TaxID=77586 RepID=A0A0D9V233_9ORYZ